MESVIVGQPLNRIEGRQKVTGRAAYAADHQRPGLLHAYPVVSPIAAGELTRLDPGEAEKASGVVAVFHHGNIPGLRACPDEMAAGRKAGEERPPFADERISYAGQFVALVVAESFEQARSAAPLVHAEYRIETPALTLDEGIRAHGAKQQADEKSHRGDPDGAFSHAPHQVDVTYTTPVEVHNAMELHSTLAEWDGERLLLHDSTQWVFGQPKTLAYVLGLPEDKVVVKAPFVGGGFGSKLFLWPHATLAAVAARALHRPVKLVLPRSLQFTTAGHRPTTRQRLRLGAQPDGLLVAVMHDSHSHTSLVTDYVESCGDATPSLYSCPNLSTTHQLIQVNVGTPTSMRGPGACPGLYALESALDELAIELRMDPLELRRRNLPPQDEGKKLPWSSIHFDDCLTRAAERFGWGRRDPRPGAMRAGGEILGWGLAAASWPAHRSKASVRLELLADGTARVSCATQDIGTGTTTVFAQVVAELTSLPMAKIDVLIGDSTLPPGPISGGSMATATVVPAIAQATAQAVAQLRAAAVAPGAPLAGADPATLTLRGGALVSGSRTVPFAEIFRASHQDWIRGEAHTEPGEEKKRFSFRAFGAHCVEVRWDPAISRLRVSRIVTVIDAGRIINRKMAHNQIAGSLLMGLGMALLEESRYDSRSGRVVTDNLADYHLAVHADTPQMEIEFLDRPDPQIGEFGAKGLGEIGVTGIAAAIGNAVYHATGKRIRDLPITISRLLA